MDDLFVGERTLWMGEMILAASGGGGGTGGGGDGGGCSDSRGGGSVEMTGRVLVEVAEKVVVLQMAKMVMVAAVKVVVLEMAELVVVGEEKVVVLEVFEVLVAEVMKVVIEVATNIWWQWRYCFYDGSDKNCGGDDSCAGKGGGRVGGISDEYCDDGGEERRRQS